MKEEAKDKAKGTNNKLKFLGKLDTNKGVKVFSIAFGALMGLLVLYILYMGVVAGRGPLPEEIKLSNVTGRSVTVSWVTEEPTYGVVAYREEDKWKPFVNSSDYDFAYDDRDVMMTSMEGEKVSKLGKYYTHHVTLRNLEPNKSYSYRVVYGIKPVTKAEYPLLKTGSDLALKGSPVVIQGGAIANFSFGNVGEDGVVYAKVKSFETGAESNLVSTVLDNRARYSLDLSNVRSSDLNTEYGEVKVYDRVELEVVGSKENGKGRISDIVANGNPYPTVLMLDRETMLSRWNSSNTESYSMGVGSSVLGESVGGEVLGETCTCPDGYLPPSADGICWRADPNNQSIQQSMPCTKVEDPSNPTTPETLAEPTQPASSGDKGWATVELVSKDPGTYCTSASELCKGCKVVNGAVQCTSCSGCPEGQECQPQAPGVEDKCDTKKGTGTTPTTPTTGGSGSVSTSRGAYGSGGEAPKTDDTKCKEGAVWYESTEKHCDMSNSYTVTYEGKEVMFYPQVWQELVYQCVKEGEGTKWISYTKTGRATGDACKGDETNIKDISDAEKQKIADLNANPNIAGITNAFKPTCNAGSYDVEKEVNGEKCVVTVTEKADCTWDMTSDCGINLNSQQVDPGRSGGAETKPDPAVATKIANMMNLKQCQDLVRSTAESDGNDATTYDSLWDKSYFFLPHPDYKAQGYGYCYFGEKAGSVAGSCDPTIPNSCASSDGVKRNCAYSQGDGQWGCLSADEYCNPFSNDANQCKDDELSICLLVSDGRGNYSSQCSEVNASFENMRITNAADLEALLQVTPATPNMSADELKSLAGIVEFRNKAESYFNDVGLYGSEVKGVFDIVCHNETNNVDTRNGALCNVISTNEEFAKKFDVNVKIENQALIDNFGYAKSGECQENHKEIKTDINNLVICVPSDQDLSKNCVIGDLACVTDQFCESSTSNCLDKAGFSDTEIEEKIVQCNPKEPLSKNGCGANMLCDRYGACHPMWPHRTPPKLEDGIGSEGVVPMVNEQTCREKDLAFVRIDGSMGYCAEYPDLEHEKCWNQQVKQLVLAGGQISCYKQTGENDTHGELPLTNPSGEKIVLEYYFPIATTSSDSDPNNPRAVTINYECGEGFELKYINIGLNSRNGKDSLLCVRSKPATSNSLPNRDLTSPVYAGGGSINNNLGVTNGKVPQVLGASTTMPFEIVDGQLVLRNAGMYDLEMSNKNMVAPKIMVEEGVEEARMEFYIDLNMDGRKDAMEPVVDAKYLGLSVKSDSVSRVYDIKKGWNLIALPLVFKTTTTAKDVYEEFDKSNIQLKDLAVYRSGKWLVYSYDNLRGYFGTNFEIGQSEGFFVNALNGGTFLLRGREFTSGVPMYLNTGWNLVGVVGTKNTYTGQSLLKSINETRVNNELQFSASQILRFGSGGRYDIDAIDTKTGEVLGNVGIEKVDDREGYFLKLESGSGVFKP